MPIRSYNDESIKPARINRIRHIVSAVPIQIRVPGVISERVLAHPAHGLRAVPTVIIVLQTRSGGVRRPAGVAEEASDRGERTRVR